MCQAYEGEARYMRARELADIRAAYDAHVSGEKKLTDEEIKDLVIRKLMLEDA